MAFSADGTTWGPWEPYQAVTDWMLPPGDGTKTLWAKVESSAGIASEPASASIVLDTERPTVDSVDPPVNADLVGPRPMITVTFSEAIDPASWASLGLVLQTPDGVLIPGTYAMGPLPDVATFRPARDLVTGDSYVLSLGAVRDVAGNLVAPIGSWVAVDRAAPQVSLGAAPRVVSQGATALLAGRLVAPTGVARLSLEARPGGSAEVISLGTVPVAVDGTFSVRVTPASTTEYRFLVPAAGDYGAGSAGAIVAVRRAIRITGPGSSVVRTGRCGSTRSNWRRWSGTTATRASIMPACCRTWRRHIPP
jgi:hypothetical protein